jgi:hypothetical protein
MSIEKANPPVSEMNHKGILTLGWRRFIERSNAHALSFRIANSEAEGRYSITKDVRMGLRSGN